MADVGIDDEICSDSFKTLSMECLSYTTLRCEFDSIPSWTYKLPRMGTRILREFVLLYVQVNCVKPPEECIRCRSLRSRSSRERESAVDDGEARVVAANAAAAELDDGIDCANDDVGVDNMEDDDDWCCWCFWY